MTQSRIKDFNRCTRRHFYNYELGIDTTEKQDRLALDFGTAIHKGLEKWWDGENFFEVLQAAKNESIDRHEISKINALLIGYDELYKNHEYKTVAVEKEFCIPLRNPRNKKSVSRTFQLAGKIDAIAKDEFGEYWIVEHKTTSQNLDVESSYWDRLVLDDQISMYIYAAQNLGYDVSGCVYDVIKKPALRPYKATPVDKRKYRKDGTLYQSMRDKDESHKDYFVRIAAKIAENPSSYYRRTTVVRSEKEINYFEKYVWAVAEKIRFERRLGVYTKNAQSCTAYNKQCKYFDLCSGASSLDDDKWVKKNKINAELEIGK